MSNKTKQTGLDWLFDELWNTSKDKFTWNYIKAQAKIIEENQIKDYVIFIAECYEKGLPPITFDNWINLENNKNITKKW